MGKEVQLENGYTKIANELLEEIYKKEFNSTQLKIILLIIRFTYGYNRKSHELSLSFMVKATGISKRYVSEELKKLINNDVVLIIKEHTDISSRKIGINKNYTNWNVRSKVQQVNNPSTGEELDYTTGEQSFYTTGEQSFYQERKDKEILKEKDSIISYKDIYDYYLTLNLIKHKTYKPEMVSAMKRAIKELNCDAEHLKILLKRHEEKVRATKDSKYPIKIRGITEFFGQKKSNGTQLICSDYDDDVYISNKNEGMDDLDIELKKIMGGD